MIFFDTTKTGAAGHRSGLTRVSARLRAELGPRATPAAWEEAARRAGPGDWFLTTELFCEEERPGFSAFLAARRCRKAAVFHDAIPLRQPHITWPQSVARHPGYMKLLAQFDRVWAVSAASRADLLGYWRWAGVENPPPVAVLALGADGHGAPRVTAPRPAPRVPSLLCVGILEPRKNQALLLDVCEDLWAEGLAFELHLVGRVNPHFGRPLVARIAALRRTRRTLLHFHEAADDATVAALYASARATLFPTIAEGCGLPLLESLWQGVPCVCSDLPVLRENADAGGCLGVAADDRAAWRDALRRIVTDDALVARLGSEALVRPLPPWRAAADALATALA
ncbi:MAG: glycosyltransferase [Opitutaceae bacterium]|nr:glycosyltransferase [Opitutaceae bacterium]